MTRIARGLVIGALLMAAACGPKTIAPPGAASWELRGSIEAISSSRLDVRHKSGRIVELALDDRTELLGAAGQTTTAVLVPGMRVAVRVETEPSGAYRAQSVRVFN